MIGLVKKSVVKSMAVKQDEHNNVINHEDP